MAESLSSRLKHAWNAFVGKDDRTIVLNEPSFSYRPDRPRMRYRAERTIISAIYTRIAIDASNVDIKHVKLDDQGRYISDVNSGLNTCITKEANIDQTGRAFIQDTIFSMLDEGVVAIVPVDTTLDPYDTGAYDIQTLRCGKIVAWYPSKVKVELYNEKTGQKEDVTVSKSIAAIVQNPFYEVMNASNSTLQRLIRKLSMLDQVDDENLGKLQMIIQLPYIIKSDLRKQQAEKRRKEIESQLVESKYGIAYTDGTEKITQINRPLENNLMAQIEYLTNTLYGQLGITPEILNGTADERVMLNYNNRTIEPIVAALCSAMERSFLTKTAKTQRQAIKYFTNPFRLVPLSSMAEFADKFTRNEIMTSNEIRQIIGMKPANDPKADMLVNSNLNQSPEALGMASGGMGGAIVQEGMNNDLLNMDPSQMTDEQIEEALALLDQNDAELDDLEAELDNVETEEGE